MQGKQYGLKKGEISLEVLVAVILVVAAVISLGAFILDATPFY